MKIEIDLTKSAAQNMSALYERVKALKQKRERIIEAIRRTEEELKAACTLTQHEKVLSTLASRPKQWYEAYRFSFTSGGKLMLIGRSAKENELLVKKYLEKRDLFFHADIHGGAVVILKNGISAEEEELKECAQLTASYSRAWKQKISAIDVYAVKKEQVEKLAGLPTGSFAIKGKRMWFYNTPLAILITKEPDGARVYPTLVQKSGVIIKPGKQKKEKLAKKVAKLLGCEAQEILPLLPGEGEVVSVKK